MSEQGEDCETLLQEYRKLKKETEDRKNELTSLQNQSLSEIVSRVNDLVTKVKAPQECRLDAEVFKSLVHCSDLRARRLSLSAPFLTPMDCVMKIKEKYGIPPSRHSSIGAPGGDDDDEECERRPVKIDWRRMGEDLAHLMNSPPPVRCMLGFMHLEPRVVKPAIERKKRAKVVASGSAEVPVTREEAEGTEYDSHLNKYLKKLKAALEDGSCDGGIDVTLLTIDYDSYIESVMYTFALSFLVNYGKVRLQSEGDRLFAYPVSREEQRRGGGDYKQLAIKMTMKKWKDECERFSRGECKMTE